MTYAPALRLAPRARLSSRSGGMMRRALRLGLMAVGGVLVVAGVLIAPLPGPFGLPLVVVGLVLVLRNSMGARRAFIKAQRRHPKMVFPLRRLLRREPEVLPVAWQQVLRAERLVLPRRGRPARGLRRRLFRRQGG